MNNIDDMMDILTRDVQATVLTAHSDWCARRAGEYPEDSDEEKIYLQAGIIAALRARDLRKKA